MWIILFRYLHIKVRFKSLDWRQTTIIRRNYEVSTLYKEHIHCQRNFSRRLLSLVRLSSKIILRHCFYNISSSIVYLLGNCLIHMYFAVLGKIIICDLYALGVKCPVCSKVVISEDIELHLVVCLTKPRLSYNGRYLINKVLYTSFC